MVPRQRHGRQPEFRMLPIAADMNVHGLVAVETVKEEPVRPGNARNPRHFSIAPSPMISGFRRICPRSPSPSTCSPRRRSPRTENEESAGLASPECQAPFLGCGQFHEHICDVLPLGHQEAVWDLGRNVNQVTGRERMPFPTLYSRTQVLADADAGLGVDHSAT